MSCSIMTGRASVRSSPVELTVSTTAPDAVQDRRDRARRDDDPLEEVEVHADRVRDGRLDGVGVRHRHDRAARMARHELVDGR